MFNLTAQNGPKPEDQKKKKWRAKVDCIYNRAYIAAGTVVSAAVMKNPHFEEVIEEEEVE
jgi:hypothetical protein